MKVAFGLTAAGLVKDSVTACPDPTGLLLPKAAVGGVAAMVIYRHRTGETVVVDGSSFAPAQARADMFGFSEICAGPLSLKLL